MRQSHLILSNAAIMWISRVFMLVPQLILVPFLIRNIGEAGYGVYALVWSLMMSIEQLQLSLQQGVVKYSAGFLAQGRMDEVNKVVSTSFVYAIFLAVVACAGTLVAASFYKGPSGQIGFALFVVSIMVLFIFPLTPYIAVIQARQRYYVDAIAETVSKYISLLAVVIWFRMVAPSVEALIIIMAGTLFLSRLAQVPVAYRLVPGLRNRPGAFDRHTFRLIVSFGSVIVLLSLCIAANTTGIRWLMGIMASTSFVAHLAIILMPAALLSQIVQAMTLTIMPATSAYDATEDYRMLRELLIRSMRYSSILVLAGVIVAALLMRNVLGVWVGSDYEFLGGYALAIFCSVAFLMSTSSAHHMLKGMGKLKLSILNSVVGLVIVPITLILAVFLIWRNPYIAVMVGIATGNIVYGIMQIGFGMKAVHADFRDLFMRAYGQPIVVAAPVFLIALCLVTYGGIEGLLGRTLVSGVAVMLFFVGSYLFIASAAEQQQWRELMQLALNRFYVIQGKAVGRKWS
ncbi:MAG: hypothetical protein WC476_12215 [Phycisphaerae bacterium]|jgi:O-antigen/teichoic acid export membrane protein